MSRSRAAGSAVAGLVLSITAVVALIVFSVVRVGIVSYESTRRRAEIKITEAMLEEVENALEMYYTDVAQYPTDEEGLAALTTKPDFQDEDTGKKWNGPYLKKTPKDAWGNEMIYQPTPDAGQVNADGTPAKAFNLFSKGPDGQEDTDDDIKLQGGHGDK